MVGISVDIYAMGGEAVYSRGKCGRKNAGPGNDDQTKEVVPKKQGSLYPLHPWGMLFIN